MIVSTTPKKKVNYAEISKLPMARLVAFLRGINVGGRSVTKDRLQSVFRDLGFEGVDTYRQSGNVIFEASATEKEKAKSMIEAELRRSLGYDVAVFIRTFADLRKVLESAPRRQNACGSSLLVTLLPSSPRPPLPLPLTIPKSTAEVVSARGAEVFSETHGGGEGALPNPFLELKLEVKATTRNLNVIREIVERYG